MTIQAERVVPDDGAQAEGAVPEHDVRAHGAVLEHDVRAQGAVLEHDVRPEGAARQLGETAGRGAGGQEEPAEGAVRQLGEAAGRGAAGQDERAEGAVRQLGEAAGRGAGGQGVRAERVTAEQGVRDLGAAERAAAAFLEALGLDLTSDSLAETPARMARAYAELLTPREFKLTTFDNDEGYDELVVARSIPIRSVCEHHLLPFVGVAHVGYLPGDRILGLSKLARVVELFASRAQVQERLTKQVAGWLDTHLQPRGVGVVIEAEHMCMTLRGVQAVGSRTVTSTLLGAVREDARTRAEFLAIAGLAGVKS
jgi:GTP cyclohydrolase I